MGKKKVQNSNLQNLETNQVIKPSAAPGGAPKLSASLQNAIDSLIKSGPNLLSGGTTSGPQAASTATSSTSAGDYFSAYGKGRGGGGGY